MKILTIVNKTEEKFLRTKTADFDFSEHTKKDIDGLIKKWEAIFVPPHTKVIHALKKS